MDTKIFNKIISITQGFFVVVALLASVLIVKNAFAAGPQVSTLPATSTATTLTLNGNFSNGVGTTQVRFQYGTTPLLEIGFTAYQSFSTTSGGFTHTLTGLTSGTTYYFRAEGINSSGPGFGSTLNLATLSYSLPQAQTLPYSNLGGTTVTAGGWYQSATPATVSIEYANNNSFIGSYTSSSLSRPAGSGAYTISLSGLTPSTTYYYRAKTTNSGGTVTATTAIPFTTLASGGNTACTINSFGTSTTINPGGTATLSWNTSNCNSLSISGLGSVTSVNSTTVTPATTTTYTISGVGSDGIPHSSSVTITVTSTGTACVINSFGTSTTITTGSSAALSWSTSNCNSLTISNIGGVSGTSSTTVSPSTTTTYTISGVGSDGILHSSSVTITVTTILGSTCSINSFFGSPSTISYGGSSTLTWNTSNCSSVTISGPGISNTYSANSSVSTGSLYSNAIYYITANGNGGSVTSNTSITLTNTYIPPYVPLVPSCTVSNFYASPSQVVQGGTTTLSWNTQNCNSVNISGGSTNIQNQNTNGSYSVSVPSNTTYYLTAFGNSGSAQAQVYVSVITNQTYTNPACSDGIDNDGDGRTDGNDPGCSSISDTSEYNSTGGTVTYTGGSTTTNTGTTGGTLVFGSSVRGNGSDYYNRDYSRNNLAGLALFGGTAFPGSVLGWLLIILIVMTIVIITRKVYGLDSHQKTVSHH